jgi:protein TonB
MSGLAEDSFDESPARAWIVRAGVALGVLAVAGLLVWTIHGLMSETSGPKRQTVKIALLPDVPPPPPPPPKEEKKPEPKEDVKRMVESPKVEQLLQAPQLKMEGPAGDAPSPFTGGEVSKDYAGGDIGGGNGLDKYAYYINRLSQLIQDELTHRKLHEADAKVLLWLSADGAVQRFKLVRASGGTDTERQMLAALAEIKRVQEAPPADMPMPVGLDISMQ